MKRISNKRLRLVIGLVAGLALSCAGAFALLIGLELFSPTTVTAHSERVRPAGAETATVRIDMPAGMLEIRGGDDALLAADFRYSNPQTKPSVSYSLQVKQGNLRVQQPERAQSGLRRIVNRWQLQLNRHIPLALAVSAGEGVHSLDLHDLALQDTRITFPQSGMMSVNLAGYWQEDVDVTLEGGQGLLVVTLPQGMQARVELDDGAGLVNADGLTPLDDTRHVYVNDRYGPSAPTLRVRIVDHSGEITLRAGLPGDLPVDEALKLARLIYAKHGTFDCDMVPDDGQYLSSDRVRDLWYDYLCERGPEQRVFDGDDPLTRELAASELVDQIRRAYYQEQADISGATMKFNVGEFMSATVDMLLKARKGPEDVEFSLTHFMGSFTYSVERLGDRLYFTIENRTDLASGTHLPLRFPDAGYTASLEMLVAQEPQLADAYLLELVQSNKFPIISVLEAKSRQETRDEVDEGGGNLHQTFTWSEPYLTNFDDLPTWPDYVRQLDIR